MNTGPTMQYASALTTISPVPGLDSEPAGSGCGECLCGCSDAAASRQGSCARLSFLLCSFLPMPFAQAALAMQ